MMTKQSIRWLEPDKCKPKKQVPAPLIKAAMADLPAVLADILPCMREDSLVELRMVMRKRGHTGPATNWAIHEHLKARRIKIALRERKAVHRFDDKDDEGLEYEVEYRTVSGTPALQDWWESVANEGSSTTIGTSASPEQSEKPFWDKGSRELWLGPRSVLVKRYRAIAENVIAVLDAFQARGWPPCIKDPNWGKYYTDTQSYGSPNKFDTIDNLNWKAKGMYFHGADETKKIGWSVGKKKSAKGKKPRK